MDIEPAEIDAYMAGKGIYSEKEWVAHLYTRYESIKTAYKSLKLIHDELELRKDEAKLKSMRSNFTENYKSRAWVVRELRKAGEKVEDKFVTD